MPEQSNTTGGMGTGAKLAIVAVLAAAVTAVVTVRNRERAKPDGEKSHPAASAQSGPLPRLLDLGAGKCIPCKMMEPVLEELRVEYHTGLKVDFIDVWKNPDAGKKHQVQSIPTQIFFDPEGKELFRHVGFFSKKDILAKWKELGFSLTADPAVPAAAPDQKDETAD